MKTRLKSINVILVWFLNLLYISIWGCDVTTPKNKISEVYYWSLSTGSKIAYVHISAPDSSSAIPLVFVHGGPGAYQLRSYLEGTGKGWFHKLAKQGFDVYLYDQIGSGLSARLANPAEYKVARHVADLEAIRKEIGEKRFILIGDSWGASLTANYMAEYPNNVEKAIFTSPGMIDLSEWIEPRGHTPQVLPEFLNWISNTQSEKVIEQFLKLDTLIRINVENAYNIAPDSLVDPMLDEFTSSVLINTVHDKDLVSKMKMHGMGWWVYTMTNYDAMNRDSHPLLKLTSNSTPVLIMRGESDYIDWEVAYQYETTFKNSKLIQVPEAGHLLWLDKPDVYTKAIESFLKKNHDE